MDRYDVIVVGLGAVGSAALYHLARSGVRAMGVDRFSPPHAMGSSHGDTRITRRAVGEGDAYVPIVERSHALWRELEAESGESLLQERGVLIMSPSGAPSSMHGNPDFLGTTIRAAERHGIPHEVLTEADLVRRASPFHLDRDYVGYYEPGGGYVEAEAAVAAHLAVAERLGARVRRSENVTGVRPAGEGVRVTTDRAEYRGAAVVLAMGAWLPQLVAGSEPGGLRGLLPPDAAGWFTVYRQTLVWFGAADAAMADVPVFIWQFGTGDEDVFYGFPALDGPDGGVKIGTENFTRPTTHGAVKRDVTPTEVAETFDRCVRGRIPALRPEAVRSAACLYTVTPDFGFVLDRHPEHQQVIIASPCSGHGFKHSPAVGEAVAQLAIGYESGFDRTSFSLQRFIP